MRPKKAQSTKVAVTFNKNVAQESNVAVIFNKNKAQETSLLPAGCCLLLPAACYCWSSLGKSHELGRHRWIHRVPVGPHWNRLVQCWLDPAWHWHQQIQILAWPQLPLDGGTHPGHEPHELALDVLIIVVVVVKT